MKTLYLSIILFCLLSIIFIPFMAGAVEEKGIVQCGNGAPTFDKDGKCTNCCGIGDFFDMLGRIYSFIVLQIATPLAIISTIIGGILMMISAGNPNLMSLGKKIFYSAIIGLALVFGSYVIISFVLSAVGFTGNWSNPF